MNGILLETEAHEDGFATKNLLKGCDDRYRATSSGRKRSFAEGYLETFLCRFIGRNIDRTDITLSPMHRRDVYAHTLGCERFDITHERTRDSLMVLIRHQATGDLRKGFRRKNGLRSFARIPAPYTAYIERRTAGVTLEGAIPYFAEDIIHIDRFVICLLREGYLRNHRPLRFRDR